MVESDLLRGEWSDPLAGRVPLGEYGQRWIEEHRLGQRTREEYDSLWRRHIGPYVGRIELAEISTDTIRSWRATLLRDGRSQDRTAKAYRLLRAVLNTAVDDGKIKRNPCRIKSAGDHRAAERPTATIAQVYALAERMPGRFLVLAAAFTGLRWGELIALRRCDVDLAGGVLHVRRRLAQPRRGGLQEGPPKSAAGVRSLALPEILAEELSQHIDQYAGPGPEGLVFRGPRVPRCGAATSAAPRSGRPWSRKWVYRPGSTSMICATPATNSPPHSSQSCIRRNSGSHSTDGVIVVVAGLAVFGGRVLGEVAVFDTPSGLG